MGNLKDALTEICRIELKTRFEMRMQEANKIWRKQTMEKAM